MKKSLMVATVLVLAFLATVTVVPETASATTYFVGGAGPANYTTIQSAVNVAGLGDTIYVYSGIYRENLVISSAIRLVGENRDTTIIDAQGTQTTIIVNSDSVRVSEFTITNGNLGVGLDSVNGCEVFSNVISNNGNGISVSDSVGSIIRDNVISSNRYNGVSLSTSGSVQISGNVISSNGDYGVRVSYSVGNLILNNHVSSNEHGIYLDSSSINSIVGNTAWSNDYSSSPRGAGIWLRASSNNQIQGNNASSNDRDGIRLEDSASNIITGNTMFTNSYGIYLQSSSANVINDNRVSLNGADGVYFDSSSSNTISRNSISSNNYGIRLSYSGNNTIFSNSVSSNEYYGLYMSLSDSNRIYHNNIVGNYNQVTDDGANAWDDGYPSGGNYWSDYEGIDQYSGPLQNQVGNDGVGDFLYYIYPGSSVDHYPMMNPNSVPPSPPSQPRNIQATPGDGHVCLNWNAPAYDGGSPVLNYRIYRREGSGSFGFLVQIGDVLTFTDTGLTNGIQYRYRISARNQIGEGLDSEDVTATPARVPGQPLGLAAVAESRLVTLTWMPPSDDGGSPITNFNVYRGLTPGGESLLAVVGNVQQYVDIGLTNGVTYFYRISAKNEVGEGAMSDGVSATPAAVLTLPGPPTRVTASAGNRQIALAWAAPVDNGGSPVTNYSIYRGAFSGAEAFLIEIGNVLTFNDTELTNGQTYSYKVTARNAIGEGPKSDSISAIPRTVPGPPIGVAAVPGDGQMKITWMSPIDDGGSPITHYGVYRGLSPGGLTYLTTPGNVLTFEDTGLTNGMTYYYQIIAWNAVGEGAKSPEVSATPMVPPPNQAPLCTISNPTEGETISERYAIMGTASDADGEIEFVEFRVGNSGWMRAIGTTSWSYDLDTTAFSNGMHTIYVRAFDGENYSAIGSSTVKISNTDGLPPDAGLFDWVITLALVVILIVLLIVLGVVLYFKRGGQRAESAIVATEERGNHKSP